MKKHCETQWIVVKNRRHVKHKKKYIIKQHNVIIICKISTLQCRIEILIVGQGRTIHIIIFSTLRL